MKEFFLFVVLSMYNLSIISQNIDMPIDKNTGKITYSEIIQLDNNISKDELYLRAKEWFVDNFNDAKNVIQIDDKETGKIIGKGIINVNTYFFPQNIGYVRFKVSIYVKDNRYKYIFTDFWHEKGLSDVVTAGDLKLKKPGGGISSMGMKNWNNIKKITDENIKALIISLKNKMETSTENENDW